MRCKWGQLIDAPISESIDASALSSTPDSTHIGALANRPARAAGKHSRMIPARPTRAKAARPDSSPLDPSLADILNPAIGHGRAGVGSQTGSPSPLVGGGGVGDREGKSRAVRNAREQSSSSVHQLPTPT